MCTQLARICCGRFTNCFAYGFVFQMTREKALCRKDFTSNLKDVFYENNRNCNFYKLTSKFAFIPFFILLQKPKTRPKFLTSWWFGIEKCLWRVFIFYLNYIGFLISNKLILKIHPWRHHSFTRVSFLSQSSFCTCIYFFALIKADDQVQFTVRLCKCILKNK